MLKSNGLTPCGSASSHFRSATMPHFASVPLAARLPPVYSVLSVVRENVVLVRGVLSMFRGSTSTQLTVGILVSLDGAQALKDFFVLF